MYLKLEKNSLMRFSVQENSISEFFCKILDSYLDYERFQSLINFFKKPHPLTNQASFYFIVVTHLLSFS